MMRLVMGFTVAGLVLNVSARRGHPDFLGGE